MRKKLFIFLFIIAEILLLSLVILIYFAFGISSPAPRENPLLSQTSTKSINITEDNLALYLEKESFIQDLPSSALIALKLTNKEYSIRKASITERIAENPDIIITLPSSYALRISEGFCKIIEEARNNGELKIDLKLSKAELMWKYKSMTKYSSCLGI